VNPGAEQLAQRVGGPGAPGGQTAPGGQGDFDIAALLGDVDEADLTDDLDDADDAAVPIAAASANNEPAIVPEDLGPAQ
jgi:hypothetical protein